MNRGAPVLECEGLSFAYNGRPALSGLSFSLEEGGFLGLLGPNGSGKSTLLRLISGRLSPASGRVRLWGLDAASWRPEERSRRVAFVSQDAHCATPLTVQELVLLGRRPHLGGRYFEGEEDRRAARRSIEHVGLLDRRDILLSELSGGERRLALIAMGLAQEPRLLLMDEPATHLDPRHQHLVYELLAELSAREGVSIITAGHDPNLAAAYCGKLLLLKKGGMLALGSPDALFKEETFESLYGTPVRVGRAGPDSMPFVTPVRRKR